MQNGRLPYLLPVALMVLLIFAIPAQAEDTRAKVISLELHRSTDGDRLALLLQVRNFRSGQGEHVRVMHGDELDPDEVFAQRVNGSYTRWRVGANTRGGPALLAQIANELERRGVVRVDAGVPASSPSGGKLSHFRIKAFNEPAPALGALPS